MVRRTMVHGQSGNGRLIGRLIVCLAAAVLLGLIALAPRAFADGPDASRQDGVNAVDTWSALGDRVWNDADGQGDQDGSESGINGVTVRL